MHKTKNLQDEYLGSGQLLKRAIDKYGKQYFIKEVLHIFDNEEDMKNKEAELVIPKSIDPKSYNLCEGGHGGFSYINGHKNKKAWSIKGRTATNKILANKSHINNIESFIKKRKICPSCKTVIEYEKRRNIYCNHSCARKVTNSSRKLKRNLINHEKI